MKSLADTQKLLEEHKPVLMQKFHVKTLGIFGSYVRGEQTPRSDIDVLVEFFKPVSFFTFLEFEEHLSQLLGTKVDLVTKKALKPAIGEAILKQVQYI